MFGSSGSLVDARIARVAGLDFLRALAIAMVTLFHVFPETVEGGYLGVSLFFVLTGYLLAYRGRSEAEAGRFSLKGYFVKRVRRIYPELVIVLLITAGVYSFLWPEALAGVRGEVLSILLGYNNWWQIGAEADYFARMSQASPFTHLWFLGIELEYYLLWPLLLFILMMVEWACGRRGALFSLLVLAVGASLVMPLMADEASVTRLYYGTDTRVYALLWGAVLGWVRGSVGMRGGRRLMRGGAGSRVAGVLLGASTLLAVLACFFLAGESPFVYRGGMLLVTLDFCLILYLLAHQDWGLGERLDALLCRVLSRLSYGLFLWQYPVIVLVEHYGEDWGLAGKLLELALIVILALWSDAVVRFLLKRRLPRLGSRLASLQGAAFLGVMLAGLIFMGFGVRGMATAAAERGMVLREELALRAEEQAAENEAARAAQEKAQREAQLETMASQMEIHGVALIGDSVLLGASKAIRAELPDSYIDAEVSRYVGDGVAAAENLAAQNMLGNVVVVALGTNGPIAGSERYEVGTRALLEYLGPRRQIFWVTVHCPKLKWQDTNNAYLEKMAAEHENVTLVDWHSLAVAHPEWLVEDGVHPTSEGAQAFAHLLHETMKRRLAEVRAAKEVN